MSWRARLARLEKSPAIEQLRFVRELEAEPDLTPTAALSSLPESFADVRLWGAALARVVPRTRSIEWLDALYEDRFEASRAGLLHWTQRVLAPQIVPLLIDSLTTNRGRRSVVHLEWLANALELHVPAKREDVTRALLRLVSECDGEVQAFAVRVAARQGLYEPVVVDALARRLDAVARGGARTYDELCDVEELLDTVARGGARTRRLASKVAPFFDAQPGVRAAASHAAIGMDEPLLRSTIERAFASAPDDDPLSSERAVHAFAIWQLGGPESFLDVAAAVELVDHRLNALLDLPAIDERLLLGLVRLASSPAWEPAVYSRLAAIGPAAAVAVSQLRAPPRNSPARVAYQEARWRVGLASATDVVAALDDGTSVEDWDLYVRANPTTSEWHRRVVAQIESAPPEENFALCSALAGAPAVAATFLPALVRRRYDDVVWSLWTSLSHETFWASVDAASSR